MLRLREHASRLKPMPGKQPRRRQLLRPLPSRRQIRKPRQKKI